MRGLPAVVLILCLLALSTCASNDDPLVSLEKGNHPDLKLLIPYAEAGNLAAQKELASRSYHGDSHEINYFYWYKKAAEQGDVDAEIDLLWCYHNLATHDEGEFNFWFNRLKEQANSGLPEAQERLGWIYDSNIYHNEKQAEAMEWFRKAAKQNNVKAESDLIEKFEYESDHESEKNYWLDKIKTQAMAGSLEAQRTLGLIYSRGDLLNMGEAIKWYTMAAEENNDIKSELELYEIYSATGWYVGIADKFKDQQKALYWLQKAIEQGSGEAELKMCQTTPFPESTEWCKKALAHGHSGMVHP